VRDAWTGRPAGRFPGPAGPRPQVPPAGHSPGLLRAFRPG